MLDAIARDLRFRLRVLRRHRTFTAATLLTLALGIGATTAIFSVVDGVLIRPLPYPEPDTLVGVMTRAPGAPGGSGEGELGESASMLVTYREQSRSFDTLGIFSPRFVTVTGVDQPEQIRGVVVSPGVFETLLIPARLGRWFSEADYGPGGARAVILGWGYWQRRFGGSASVIGRTIMLDSTAWEIVGVMPRDFRVVTIDSDVFFPLQIDRSRLFLVGFSYQMIGRLKHGVTITRASADLTRLAGPWMDSWGMPPGFGGVARPFESWRIASVVRPLKDDVVGNVGRLLWVIAGTIGIVMLLACANVANLVLVRTDGRQQELALRAALGAGWVRIVRELLIESLWLAMLGGALGLALAFVGVRLLVAFGPATLPRLNEITVNGRALAFTLAISLLAGFLFGVIPALRYAGRRLRQSALAGRRSTDSRDRQRTRGVLVIVQMALALVLLVGAGLMIRTFVALRTVEPGFATPTELETVRVIIPQSVATEADRVAQIQKELFETLASIPGVTSVALSSSVPLEATLASPIPSNQLAIRAESDTTPLTGALPLRWSKYVSPGYFHTVGTRLLAGRDYTWSDLEKLRPVVIVSENLAIEQWGSIAAALGQRLRSGATGSWREVIGVAEDVRDDGIDRRPPSIVYWPARMESLEVAGQMDVQRWVVFVLRSPAAGREPLLRSIRERIWAVNANLPISHVRTMQEIYSESMVRTSFTLVVLAIAGVMALALGIIGIYGVVSYAVARRIRELGIRLALGAQQHEVRRMFLREALALACLGVAVGLGAAAALTRYMTSLLFEVSSLDPITYSAVPVLLIAAALLASYVPAHRASGVDPARALSVE
jgi:predicted permease